MPEEIIEDREITCPPVRVELGPNAPHAMGGKPAQQLVVDLCDACDLPPARCRCVASRFTPVLFARVHNGPWRYFLPDRSRQD